MKWNFLQNLFGKTKTDSSESEQQDHELDEPTSDTKVLLERAKKKTKSKNYQGALEDISSILSIEPNNIYAFMERSTIKGKLKDSIGSKEDLDTAGVLLKKLDRGLKANDKGLAKFNESDYKGAIKHFNDAISNGIDLGQTYHLRGLSKKYIDDFKGAVIDLSKVIDSFPEYAEIFEAYYIRGKIRYHKLDNIDGALEDFNEAIKLKPKDADIYVSRAILKNSIEDNDGAMADYNKAIELNPKDAETFFSRALLHMSPENYLEAIKDLDMVIKLGLSNDDSVSMFDAYSMRGTSKLLLTNYEEAIKDFDKAIELEPENGKAYFDRGEAYLLLKNNEQAAEDKFMAIKLGYEEED